MLLFLSYLPIYVSVHVCVEFVKYAGVTKSLTPGRNNGFLNMLNLMKVDTDYVHEDCNSDDDADGDDDDDAHVD